MRRAIRKDSYIQLRCRGSPKMRHSTILAYYILELCKVAKGGPLCPTILFGVCHLSTYIQDCLCWKVVEQNMAMTHNRIWPLIGAAVQQPWPHVEQIVARPLHNIKLNASDGARHRCKMVDRQETVYLAKLAEQAERYDGKYRFCFTLPALLCVYVFALGPTEFFLGDRHLSFPAGFSQHMREIWTYIMVSSEIMGFIRKRAART